MAEVAEGCKGTMAQEVDDDTTAVIHYHLKNLARGQPFCYVKVTVIMYTYSLQVHTFS